MCSVRESYPGLIGRNPKQSFGLFLRDPYFHGLNFLGRKKQVYASTVGITSGFDFYIVAVKTMATMIIDLHIFILVLQKVIL